MKRFYETADATRSSDGWTVALDGRTVKTPARKPLAVPARKLADAIAALNALFGMPAVPLPPPNSAGPPRRQASIGRTTRSRTRTACAPGDEESGGSKGVPQGPLGQGATTRRVRAERGPAAETAGGGTPPESESKE